MFNPFFRVNTIDNFGIPVLRTTSVTTDTTSETVTYNICHRAYRRLPTSGLFVLHVVNTAPTTANAYPVSISPNILPVNTSTVTTVSASRPLLNGSGTQVTSVDITSPNRYLIYYNKCEGIFQIINNIVAATTPAA